MVIAFDVQSGVLGFDDARVGLAGSSRCSRWRTNASQDRSTVAWSSGGKIALVGLTSDRVRAAL